MNKNIFLPIVFLFLFFGHSFAQNAPSRLMQNKGRIGIGASFHKDNRFLLIPYWLTNSFVIVPSVHFTYFQKQELDLILGLSTRQYISSNNVSSYLGFRLGTMMYKPYDVEEIDRFTRTDLFAGLTFGMEYYLARQFSVGVEIQGDFIKSDDNSYRFDNEGGIGFKITPVLQVSFYF